MSGFVYFIRAGDFVKVGFSIRPDARIPQLRTGVPHAVHVLAILPGSRAHEREAHLRLSHIRYRGEWFRDHEDIHKMIADGLPDPISMHIETPVRQAAVSKKDARRAEVAREQREFAEAVYLFLLESNVSDVTFGIAACRDQDFVWRLRHRHHYRQSTRTRVFNFIAANPVFCEAA